MGLLPMPRKPIISTWAGTEEEPANWASECIRPTSLHLPENQPLEGKTLAEIADIRRQEPYDALFDLLASEHCAVSMIDYITSEEDIDAILRAPFSSVISDATYPVGGL